MQTFPAKFHMDNQKGVQSSERIGEKIHIPIYCKVTKMYTHKCDWILKPYYKGHLIWFENRYPTLFIMHLKLTTGK